MPLRRSPSPAPALGARAAARGDAITSSLCNPGPARAPQFLSARAAATAPSAAALARALRDAGALANSTTLLSAAQRSAALFDAGDDPAAALALFNETVITLLARGTPDPWTTASLIESAARVGTRDAVLIDALVAAVEYRAPAFDASNLSSSGWAWAVLNAPVARAGPLLAAAARLLPRLGAREMAGVLSFVGYVRDAGGADAALVDTLVAAAIAAAVTLARADAYEPVAVATSLVAAVAIGVRGTDLDALAAAAARAAPRMSGTQATRCLRALASAAGVSGARGAAERGDAGAGAPADHAVAGAISGALAEAAAARAEALAPRDVAVCLRALADLRTVDARVAAAVDVVGRALVRAAPRLEAAGCAVALGALARLPAVRGDAARAVAAAVVVTAHEADEAALVPMLRALADCGARDAELISLLAARARALAPTLSAMGVTSALWAAAGLDLWEEEVVLCDALFARARAAAAAGELSAPQAAVCAWAAASGGRGSGDVEALGARALAAAHEGAATSYMAQQLLTAHAVTGGAGAFSAADVALLDALRPRGVPESSIFGRSVAAALRREYSARGDAVEVREEAPLLGGLHHADVLLVFAGGERVVVECDGPRHFFRALHGPAEPPLRRTGATCLRNKVIVAAGCKVVCVPYYEWEAAEARGGEGGYVARLVAAARAPLVGH